MHLLVYQNLSRRLVPFSYTTSWKAVKLQHKLGHLSFAAHMRVTRSGRCLDSRTWQAPAAVADVGVSGTVDGQQVVEGLSVPAAVAAATRTKRAAEAPTAEPGAANHTGFQVQPSRSRRISADRAPNSTADTDKQQKQSSLVPRRRKRQAISADGVTDTQSTAAAAAGVQQTAAQDADAAAAAAAATTAAAAAAAAAGTRARNRRRQHADPIAQNASAAQHRSQAAAGCSFPAGNAGNSASVIVHHKTVAGDAAAAAAAATAAPAAAAASGSSNAAGTIAAAAAAGAAGGGTVLLDLGDLVPGEVLKRPSATVKSPYVADVRLLGCGTAVLVHTPALDGAGLIMPGATVHMTANATRSDGQKATKTSHAVQLAEDHCEGGQVALVGAHPQLAEKLAEAALQRHLLPLPAELQGYTSVLKQQTVGNGRFDFALCYSDGSRLLLEVKNVTCADYPAGKVPPQRGKVCLYTSAAEPYSRTALFPVGAANKSSGVVSDRAIKHLNELTLLQQAGIDSQGRSVRCAVLFLVNRSDCAAFRPCHEADTMFARMLKRAQQCGVLVVAHDICWRGGRAVWGKPLPVVYGQDIQAADVDEQQLQAVLEFNATNPRTHWKKQ